MNFVINLRDGIKPSLLFWQGQKDSEPCLAMLGASLLDGKCRHFASKTANIAARGTAFRTWVLGTPAHAKKKR